MLLSLFPALRERFGDLPAVIGGYSLGGLFSLWAAAQTDSFRAVAAASPSVWIRNWQAFSEQHALLQQQLGPERCTLVWEPGNHFTDNEGRLARAFAWCVGRL